MFVIFGQSWQSKPFGQIEYQCSHCRRPTVHTAILRTGRFTLFFVPLIPLKTDCQLVCNICGFKLKAAQALQVQLQTWHRTGRLPAPSYRPSPIAVSDCQHLGNPADAKFCWACGKPITGAGLSASSYRPSPTAVFGCQHLGNPADAKFCWACGKPITKAVGIEPPDERR